MTPRATPLLVLLLILLWTSSLAAQNSTRKIRPEPGPLASRAGSAVQWRRDLARAKDESERTGKPLFWYIPTVSGSPMDRRPEIDRYMMAGPFSWPSTIALLNESFIPVKAEPGGGEQRDRKLRPGEFIEPGYLVLDDEGQELYRLDKITTLHPDWFEAPLRDLVDSPVRAGDRPAILRRAWRAYADSGPEAARSGLPDSLPQQLDALADNVAAEVLYLVGAIYYRQGRDGLASDAWRELIQRYPEDPWAWKTAAELEGHGPFSRGFEDYRALPARVLAAERDGSRAPAGVYSRGDLWRRSATFLLAMKRFSRGYEDSRYDFGGTDSLPNVYMAGTAIVGEALLEAQVHFAPIKGGEKGKLSELLPNALWEARAYTTDDANLNTDDTDEIIWAHLYRARFLARSIELQPETADDLTPHLQRVVDAIQDLQPGSGAWFHEYSNPFTTAAVLIALKRAERAGATVSQQHVDRGILALLRTRAQNGAYSYGYGGSPDGTRIPAAAGRMPLCELALSLWGEGKPGALEDALAAAFQHHSELEDSRKYDDHAGPYAYGGFFFWFDMHARTEAIASLPDGALKTELASKQRDLLLSLPEFDGCFVDSHELGRSYGTAMALLCFAALR